LNNLKFFRIKFRRSVLKTIFSADFIIFTGTRKRKCCFKRYFTKAGHRVIASPSSLHPVIKPSIMMRACRWWVNLRPQMWAPLNFLSLRPKLNQILVISCDESSCYEW